MNNERTPHLLGRVTITGEIEALTGLHIGGSDQGVGIGGVDKVVIRNSFDNQPYIPGSSLKGKIRSLLERARHLPLNQESKRGRDRMSEILMHSCHNQSDYDECAVCNLFGVPSNWDDKDNPAYPTRIVVRDSRLLDAEELLRKTELPYTEVKTEVSIDRLTSAANPRQFERVPAGARFGLEIVVNLYTEKDIHLLDTLLAGLGLVEGDYIGGQGTRGYGQVAFRKLEADVHWFDGAKAELPAWVAAIEREPETKSLSDFEREWKDKVSHDGFQPA
ncbi:MAG: type III-A CRISPR-associated RAMP protein Csm3 [Candidatus Sumerlaeota bacterium]|nr:type III-A CRISPR-associated RAMP protein Csm3 [Candidatus Sumerlaeota bacterium]